MWVSIFGNSAIEITRSGDERFREIAMNQPQQGFYTLLQEFPAFPLVASIATIVGLLFYITSAASGALVMGNLTSYRKHPATTPPTRSGSSGRSPPVCSPWRCS